MASIQILKVRLSCIKSVLEMNKDVVLFLLCERSLKDRVEKAVILLQELDEVKTELQHLQDSISPERLEVLERLDLLDIKRVRDLRNRLPALFEEQAALTTRTQLMEHSARITLLHMLAKGDNPTERRLAALEQRLGSRDEPDWKAVKATCEKLHVPKGKQQKQHDLEWRSVKA